MRVGDRALAALGTVCRESDGDTEPAEQAMTACQMLVRFAEFCAGNDPQELARAIDAKQAAALRKCVALADQWLDRFVMHLPPLS